MPEDSIISTASINEDEIALFNASEIYSTRSWIKSTAQEKQISMLETENIDSTTSLVDLPVTIIESIECPPPRTIVSYSTTESKVARFISTITHTNNQFLSTISGYKQVCIT